MNCKLVRPHTHMHMKNADNYMLKNKDSVANNLRQVFPVSVFSYTTHGHKLTLPPCLLWRPGVTVGVKGLTQLFCSRQKCCSPGNTEAGKETLVTDWSSPREREQLTASLLRLLQRPLTKALFACLHGDWYEGKARTPGTFLHRNIYTTPEWGLVLPLWLEITTTRRMHKALWI